MYLSLLLLIMMMAKPVLMIEIVRRTYYSYRITINLNLLQMDDS